MGSVGPCILAGTCLVLENWFCFVIDINERGVWASGTDQGSKTCVLFKGSAIRPLCVEAMDVRGAPSRGYNAPIVEGVRHSLG